MDYVMRRRSTVGGALEMFSLPLPLLRVWKLVSKKLVNELFHIMQRNVEITALLIYNDEITLSHVANMKFILSHFKKINKYNGGKDRTTSTHLQHILGLQTIFFF